MRYLSFLLSLSLFASCQSKNQEQSETVVIPTITEAQIRNYSVKFVEGKIVRDTLQYLTGTEYDETGRELSNITYELNGEVAWKEVYEYDEKGIKTGSKFYEKGDSLTAYYKYESDSLGRTIRYAGYDSQVDTFLYDVVFRYLPNGNKRSGYVNKAGEFLYNYEYQYDGKGEEIGYIYYSNREQKAYPTTYQFITYDEQNRWTERHHLDQEDKVKMIQTQTFVEKEI